MRIWREISICDPDVRPERWGKTVEHPPPFIVSIVRGPRRRENRRTAGHHTPYRREHRAGASLVVDDGGCLITAPQPSYRSRPRVSASAARSGVPPAETIPDVSTLPLRVDRAVPILRPRVRVADGRLDSPHRRNAVPNRVPREVTAGWLDEVVHSSLARAVLSLSTIVVLTAGDCAGGRE